MIITPHGFSAVNILHAVNNSYKCTDRVYMFARAEEDCNLYLQRLYWERELNDTYEAPVFVVPQKNIMLIRQDLADVDRVNPPPNTWQVPTLLYNHDGYAMDDPIFRDFQLVRYSGSGRSYAVCPTFPNDTESPAFHKFLLIQPYFSPNSVRLRAGNANLIPADLEHFDIQTTPALRLRFGEPRQVHAVLFYRTYWGRQREYVERGWNNWLCEEQDNSNHSIQLLQLPEHSDTYEKMFDLNEVQGYTEPGEGAALNEDITVYPLDCEYRGGVPCVVNLPSPISAKELFFRWTGYLTHFQLLDSPIITPEYWTLADNEHMEFNWRHLAERILLSNPSLANSIVDFSRVKIESLGDISTGIRFRHPVKAGTASNNPYSSLDYYTAEPVGYDVSDEQLGDIWRLRGVRPNPNPDYSSDYSTHWLYGTNIYEHRNPNGSLAWVERDAGDNMGYVINKLLMRWYYDAETNTWRSNYTRRSTAEQLRLLVVLPRAELVRGCINPMSNPATFNKPAFLQNPEAFDPPQYRFNLGLYQDYNVPWRVLIEGRADDRTRTPWELMDEFTLEHFSARAHTYFSYPRHVRYIRITIQDWYGNSLMEDMKKDYVYPMFDTDYRPLVGHYGKHSASAPPARDLVLHDSQDNISTLMERSDRVGLRQMWEEWRNDPLREGQNRTFQSLWKGIYIPPFLFFGDNGEWR